MVTDDADVSGNMFGVRATPTTLLVDRDGKIIFRSVGFAPGKERVYAAEIEYLLRAS